MNFSSAGIAANLEGKRAPGSDLLGKKKKGPYFPKCRAYSQADACKSELQARTVVCMDDKGQAEMRSWENPHSSFLAPSTKLPVDAKRLQRLQAQA